MLAMTCLLKNREIIHSWIDEVLCATGQSLGCMSRTFALTYAAKRDMNLYLIRDTPVVCFLGHSTKGAKLIAHSSRVTRFDPICRCKCFTFTSVIDQKDLERKLEQMRFFISEGYRCSGSFDSVGIRSKVLAYMVDVAICDESGSYTHFYPL